MRQTCFVATLTAVVWLALAPAAWGQQASGIAGLVRDTSGAVLPGVTVEAASPVLIEKVRSAVTDSQGRFNIVDLRPGTYVVTFALAGFNMLKREGVELTAGFTATINADLQVGALEETVTVTGQSPLVDVQNVKQQRVISDELLSALPSASRAMASLVAIIPGMVGAGDVGGSSGIYTSNTTWRNMYHGKGGVKFQYDGMRTNNMGAHGATSYVMNGATSEETTVDTGGVSAESSASGALINLIPKQGSNTFRTEFFGFYTGEHLQSDNLDDALRARGLTTGPKALGIYDFNGTLGGPLKADKLWFFTAGRVSQSKIQVPGVFFNATKGTPVYTPGDAGLPERVAEEPGRPADVAGVAEEQSERVHGHPVVHRPRPRELHFSGSRHRLQHLAGGAGAGQLELAAHQQAPARSGGIVDERPLALSLPG